MLIQSLIDNSKYDIKCPYTMNPKGICIHNTANDASAKNEIAYMKSNDLEVSYHIAVDDIEAIQAIPFNLNAWHAGDGGNGDGNRNYIALEICYSKSGGEKFFYAEKRAAAEVALLLKQYNWNISNVKKHQDFSRKYCPHRTLDMGWQRFLNLVQDELNKLNGSSNKPDIPVTNTNIKVGSKVKVIGSTYATGETIPSWVKNNVYTVSQISGNKALLQEIISWVYIKDLTINSVTSTPSTPKPQKQYINLKPHMNKWAVYNENGPYTLAYKIGDLAPATYGGLSYEILGSKGNDVYIIQTQTFGRVGIWVPKDNDSSFTNYAAY